MPTGEKNTTMEKIVSLCKRRGFVFPGSEIYGGFVGLYDYGPYGVELANNIKSAWWKKMVEEEMNIVGLDSAIVTHPKVWEASGHVGGFADPMVECKACNTRSRADHLLEDIGVFADEKMTATEINALFDANRDKLVCPKCGEKNFGTVRAFNLLVKTNLGNFADDWTKEPAYLRGETCQGIYLNFKNVLDSTRVKVPFGIAQIGKAFRNEITPGNFTYRSLEFEQMELEFFIKPSEKEGNKWFDYWKKQRMEWYLSLGMKQESLRFRKHEDNERAHYAKFAEDIEFNAPFGWSEFEGIHHRGDWDLSRHKLSYKDEETGEEFTPWVMETSGGVDRSALFFLLNAYHEDEKRVVLKLHPKLAPVKVAVFPLLANKLPLVKMAKDIYHNLKETINGMIAFDDRGNIGKRYYSQDEIGTPFCVTVDFQSLQDKTVTVRDRDTMKQERIGIDKLTSYFSKRLD